MLTVITKITMRGIRTFASITSAVISLKPDVAGKIMPMVWSAFGSILEGNIIPPNIIEGKNKSCDAIVSFDELLINTPSTVPTDKLTMIKTARDMKKRAKFSGICAPKAFGATINIIKLIIKR